MKTVVIWHSREGTAEFFLVDHDISHLDHVYIGAVGVAPDRECELDSCIFNYLGEYLLPKLPKFPIEAVIEGAKVIIAGQLP